MAFAKHIKAAGINESDIPISFGQLIFALAEGVIYFDTREKQRIRLTPFNTSIVSLVSMKSTGHATVRPFIVKNGKAVHGNEQTNDVFIIPTLEESAKANAATIAFARKDNPFNYVTIK